MMGSLLHSKSVTALTGPGYGLWARAVANATALSHPPAASAVQHRPGTALPDKS